MSDATEGMLDDPYAFTERVILPFTPMVRSIIGKMLKSSENPHDLEDELTNQTFERAFRCLHTFQGGSKLSTWICGIARNLTLKKLRELAKQSKFVPFNEEDDVSRVFFETESATSEAESPFRTQFMRSRFWASILNHFLEVVAILSPKERLVYGYYFAAETVKGRIKWRQADIAKALHLSHECFRALLSKARAKVSNYLGTIRDSLDAD